MNEFERLIQQRQRDAEVAARGEQAARKREQQEGAAHHEQLRRILRVAPLLADALTRRGTPTDMQLTRRRWREARKGLRKRGEWVEEPYLSGWTVVQDIEDYTTELGQSQGTVYSTRGVLLSRDGTVLGYRGGADSFLVNSLRRMGRFTVDDLTVSVVKELTPEEPWPNRTGTGTRYYFLPDPTNDYYGHFTLEDILSGLASLAVKHQIDPSTFSGV